MAQQVCIVGLEVYQLNPAALRRLGEQPVWFSVQLVGLKLHSLLPLRPKQRDLKLRAALKRQFKQLAQRFPEAHFEITRRAERFLDS